VGERTCTGCRFRSHCFTLRVAYSDWRNETYSLECPGQEAFAEAYGLVSETERRVDLPLSVLSGLLVASRRANVPGWARPLLEDVENGILEYSIQRRWFESNLLEQPPHHQ